MGNDTLRGLDASSDLTSSPNGGLFIGGPGNNVLDVGTISQGNFILIGGSVDSSAAAGNNYIQGGYGNDLLIAGNAITTLGGYAPDGTSGGNSRSWAAPATTRFTEEPAMTY